jgi:hypothetical protein
MGEVYYLKYFCLYSYLSGHVWIPYVFAIYVGHWTLFTTIRDQVTPENGSLFLFPHLRIADLQVILRTAWMYCFPETCSSIHTNRPAKWQYKTHHFPTQTSCDTFDLQLLFIHSSFFQSKQPSESITSNKHGIFTTHSTLRIASPLPNMSRVLLKYRRPHALWSRVRRRLHIRSVEAT